jgi:hypothetical protein
VGQRSVNGGVDDQVPLASLTAVKVNRGVDVIVNAEPEV